MHLAPDRPSGRPPFDLSADEIATVVDLLCLGAHEARAKLHSGMLEVPITILIRKAIRRIKRNQRLTNLQLVGEYELLDIETTDATLLGRIDIMVQFLHQFGYEDAYIGVECKRVAAGEAVLNQRYVTQGVQRFSAGRYSAGHHWGMMLGYVLKLPVEDLTSAIDKHLRAHFGNEATLNGFPVHSQALAMFRSVVPQGNQGHMIALIHIFVDMTPAA